MNNNITNAAVFLLALCSLLFFSCDGNGSTGSHSYKSFDYNLQGTWETHDSDEYYSGTLVINFNSITISGYAPNLEYEKRPNGKNQRPFIDFTKSIPLEGYSEEGKIFIKDRGILQEGIHYTYWEPSLQPPDYERIYFLSFDFGGRKETLRKQ